jgi:hypothetical protein
MFFLSRVVPVLMLILPLIFLRIDATQDELAASSGGGWLISIGGYKANYYGWPIETSSPPLPDLLNNKCVYPGPPFSNLPTFPQNENVTVKYYIQEPQLAGVIVMSILSPTGSIAYLAIQINATTLPMGVNELTVMLPNANCPGCVFEWTWSLGESGDPPLVYYGCVDLNIGTSDANSIAHISRWIFPLFAVILLCFI